ncbi:RICIN domain-containing protein [Nonomuraea angiospora]|uniref:RICIN domain-containing protein n=1 Tax=Nonomuraea angiospora TaxID=46172 RepID=UPI00379B51F7
MSEMLSITHGAFRPLAGRPRRRLRHGVGTAFHIQCANGGRVLSPGGTAQGAQVVLADDNGSNNNLWRFL